MHPKFHETLDDFKEYMPGNASAYFGKIV